MKRTVSLIVLVFLCVIGIEGQSPQTVFSPAEKKAVIDALCENLEAEYIFPDITEKYVRMLKDNLRSGKYDRIERPGDFAVAITGDLMAVHKDEHLSVWFNPEWVKNERGRKEVDAETLRLLARRDRNANYGFQEVRILAGNIGYLKFNGFSYDEDACAPAIGAMAFLARTNALIIDLRENGGGSPEMVQFLCSYLLDNPRKHLNSFSYKDPERLTQYWTYTYLPGQRLDRTDLYILTSSRTFSAAEEFTYNLKNMGRAVVIGETTGGGAHDNKFVILTDNFYMSLPFARAVNPVTKTNWEGVGVEPDVKVAQDKALPTALAMASRKLAEKEDDPRFKEYYSWHRDSYAAALNPLKLEEDALRSYVGTYGPRAFTLEDRDLMYQREGRPKLKLIPIAADCFGVEGNDGFRLTFVREDGKIVAVEGHDPNGIVDKHLKNK
jgi:hypothetical protein